MLGNQERELRPVIFIWKRRGPALLGSGGAADRTQQPPEGAMLRAGEETLPSARDLEAE